MPELPEITVLARQMKRELVGKTFTEIEVLQPKSLNVSEEAFVEALRVLLLPELLFLISDRGTHFTANAFKKLMLSEEVTHFLQKWITLSYTVSLDLLHASVIFFLSVAGEVLRTLRKIPQMLISTSAWSDMEPHTLYVLCGGARPRLSQEVRA